MIIIQSIQFVTSTYVINLLETFGNHLTRSLDILLSSHKDQNVTRAFTEMDLQRCTPMPSEYMMMVMY